MAADVSRSDCIALLAEIARGADRIAVIDDDGPVTSTAVARAAARLAGKLRRDVGVQRGDRVAVDDTHDAVTVTAIHGVLAAGAAYVPLDHSWPARRRARVLADCQAKAVVNRAGTDGGSVPAVRLDRGELTANAESRQDDDRTADLGAWAPAPGDPAYVLYTSGSTGKPKGVLVSHAAARAFVDWAVDEFAISAADVVAGHAPACFDVSTLHLFAPMLTGATLTMVPPHLSAFPGDLADFIERSGITVWYSVPFPLAALSSLGGDTSERLRSLRAVLFAGEVFDPQRLTALLALTPQARHANLYGPTETNVCTWWPVTAPVEGEVPIGRAIAGNTCAVWTGSRLTSDDVGAVGELWVSGATLADGYWQRPLDTGAAFVVEPSLPGGRAYRTGDTVRIVASGCFQFVGRSDDLVKVRGIRVDLLEVERTARSAPGVAEACVVALDDPRFGHRLHALVAPEDVSVDEVYEACRSWLPAAAVPEWVGCVPALPRTPNGKMDRVAIAALVQDHRLSFAPSGGQDDSRTDA